MLRWLYIQLIWLHPAPFRWRFGDDMLDDFDRAPNRAKLRYFADAAASVVRQWLLRPEFRHPDAPAPAAATLLQTVAVPLFQTIEPYKPRPAAMLHGGLLSILWILAAVVAIGKGGGVARPYLVGTNSSRPSLFPIDRSSADAGELDTTVKTGEDPFEAWLKLARPYFASMPVLRALDTDRDFTLSPWEISNAPAALRQLDKQHGGKAEDYGLYLGPSSVTTAAHPVLAALDADHDGVVSAREIDHASASLKTLDRNHDGYLTADELVPSEMKVRAGLR